MKQLDKGFISKIHKQLIQFNTRKTNTTIKKWEKDLNRHLYKEDYLYTDGQKAHEKMLIIREMQIKTTIRCYLTPIRMAIIKKSRNDKCWRECGEKGTLLRCWWEYILVQPLCRTVWSFFLKK